MKGLQRITQWFGGRPVMLFTLAFLLFCALYEYGRILHMRPFAHHLMRQSDCLGPAYNYCYYDGNLFHPGMCNLHADGNTGPESAGEFPLLYWLVGMLWRVIGQSELAYRAIGVLLHFAGSLALFRVAARVLRDERWGGWIALLFFTSPAVAYFAISFLPDVPAFDLAMIGGYALMRYRDNGRTVQLVLGFLCLALAALLKVSGGFTLLALIGVLAVETLFHRRLRDRWRLFPERGKAWCCAVGAVFLVVAWYAYAAWYNRSHGAPYTPNSIWPIWSADAAEVSHTWRFAKEVLVFELFAGPVWLLALASLVLVLWGARRLPLQLLLFTVFILVGAVLFVILWFRALNDHDYYFINPCLLVPVLITSALWVVFQRWPFLRRSGYTQLFAALALLFSLAYAIVDMQMRTNGKVPIARDALWPLYSEARYRHWESTQYWSAVDLLDIEAYNRSIGIKRNDLVLVVQDRTWQSCLYLMGQRGWNDYTAYLNDSATVDRFARVHGASYLFVSEPAWSERPYMRSFLQRPIGQHGNVRIFDLRHLHGKEPRAAITGR